MFYFSFTLSLMMIHLAQRKKEITLDYLAAGDDET